MRRQRNAHIVSYPFPHSTILYVRTWVYVTVCRGSVYIAVHLACATSTSEGFLTYLDIVYANTHRAERSPSGTMVCSQCKYFLVFSPMICKKIDHANDLCMISKTVMV